MTLIAKNINYNWIKVADREEDIAFNTKGFAEADLGVRKVCLVKVGDQIKACSALCPHAGAPLLKNGSLDLQGNITCCVHNYSYNINSGRDRLNEGYYLKLFPVLQNEDGIFVGL